MDLNRQLKEILQEAERKIAGLTAQALQGRDYVAVQQLSAIAERIATVDLADAPQRPPTPESSLNEKNSRRQSQPAISSAAPRVSNEGSTFPRFFRDGNQLVKIGYSKSERRTYEHRSPREVLERLVAIVLDFGRDGSQFTTESILPPAENRLANVPSYQVYLCLAFLVRRGFVRRQSRAAYKIDPHSAETLEARVDSEWIALPAR